jgi:hypothetical protein
MKRKDTKIYKELVDNYCGIRRTVECYQKEVNNGYMMIGRAKKKFDSLGLSLKEDEDIKEWYRGYTDVLQMSVGMAEHSLKDNQERLDSLSKVLVEDYEEDLDLLYELNKH